MKTILTSIFIFLLVPGASAFGATYYIDDDAEPGGDGSAETHNLAIVNTKLVQVVLDQ
jgi:hypothetical protein